MASAICASTSAEQAWEHFLAGADRLFWTDDETLAATWNRLFGSAMGGADVEELWRGEQLRYRYRGKGKVVPLRSDPDDRLICIHALARLVRRDVEFRFCCATEGNSDQAFLAMPPADWAALEASFGRSVVGACFVRLAADFDAFMERAFAEHRPVTPQLTVWTDVVSYIESQLDHVVVCDGPGQVRLNALDQLLRRYLAAGPVGLCVGPSDEQRPLDRDDLAQAVAEFAGVKAMRIVDVTRAGFVVVQLNGVAAGWRSDEPNRAEGEPLPQTPE